MAPGALSRAVCVISLACTALMTIIPPDVWAQQSSGIERTPARFSIVPQYGLSMRPSFWGSDYGRFGDGWGIDQSTKSLQFEVAPIRLGRLSATMTRSHFGFGCEIRPRTCPPSGWTLALGATLTPTAYLEFPIVPFFGGGTGLLRWDSGDMQVVTQAHAGTDVLLSPRLSVRGELRLEPDPISATMVYVGVRWHLSPD